MKTDFDVPETVATCPHTCGGKLHLEVDEWEEDGTPTEAGVHVSCDGETDDPRDIHYDMPYVWWLPLEHRVYLWAKDNVRVTETEEETRERVRAFEQGLPMQGGMGW